MHEVKTARRMPVSLAMLLLLAFAMGAAAGSLMYRQTHTAVATPSQTGPASNAAAAAVEPVEPAAEAAQAEPPLIEILQAADALVRAGVIAPPAPEPTMAEILQAADQLIQAGVMAPPEPSLRDALLAADAFKRLELLALLPPPQPSLMEILQAADALRRAGALPPPAPAPAPPPAAPIEPPAPPPAPTSTPIPPPAPAASGSVDEAFNQQVLAAVNARRAEAGLGPLTYEPRLAKAAADYAAVLAANRWFSHTGPDGSTLVDRVTAAGFPFDVQIGEVIAWGTDGWQPPEIVQAWMDSPPHRQQILEPVYTRAGVGCFFSVEDGRQNVRCVMDLAG